MTSIVTETVNDTLKHIVAETNSALQAVVDGPIVPDNLRDAVAYSLLGPGKRLRPTLTLLSAQAAGGDRADAMPAAVAIELIHAFSLVHDDLPAMDDDDLRRGRPTLHVHADEATAILTGDVMVTIAMSHLARAPLPPACRLELLREIADATTAMIEGQVYDTLGGFGGDVEDAARLETTHALKTGALLEASCRCGGLAVGADEGVCDALSAYGRTIGLMFQAVDDLLDETQTTEHLGKASGKDKDRGKLTAPEVHGLDGTRERIAEYERIAREALAPLGRPAQPLQDLCTYMANRTR